VSLGFTVGRLDFARLIEQAQQLEDFEEAIAAAARALPADPLALVEFFEVPSGDAFDVPPERAMAYFKAKGLKPTFSYADMLDHQHDAAFTVAKMMSVDMLGQVRDSLDSAMATGTPFKEWADSITPILQSGGWWGRKAVLDPLTGQEIVAQLGSPWRLETIFRTNMQTAYAAGAWQEIDAQKDIAPFLMYDAVDDFRTRPLHASWDRKVLPVKHAWWGTHYPPNGYNCRCGVIQLSADEVEALGLQVARQAPDDGVRKWVNPRDGLTYHVPNGIDPGFEHNSGKSHLANLKQIAAEKESQLASDMKAAAQKADARALAKAKAIGEQATQAAAAAQAELAAAEGKAALVRAKAKADEAAKQWAAQQQLDAIAKGKETAGAGAQYKIKALAESKKHSGWPELKATEKLDAVLGLAAQFKAKAVQSQALHTYKKAILEGKTPQPSAAKIFNKLPDADKQAFLKGIDEQKAQAAAALKAAEEAALKAAAKEAQDAAGAKAQAMQAPQITTGAPPNAATLTQVGPQKGSNPGGLFQDTSTGERWYVKWPPDEEMIRNEVLSAKLYELGGVAVPEVHVIQFNGRTAIASRFVDGLAKAKAPAALAAADGAAQGFAFDAWLANWDAVGLTYDNMLVKAGKAYRIDVGGSLRFKATGSLKPGSSFGPTVGELDTMKDATLNPQAASVFGQIDQAEFEQGVKRLLAIDEAQIRALVEAYGPKNAATRAKLADTLIARRADIAKRFAGQSPPSAEALKQATEEAAEKISYARGLVDDAILTAVKGIAKRAAGGAALDAKDLQRVAEAEKRLAELRTAAAAVMRADSRAELLGYYEPWLADLQAAVKAGAGAPAKWGGGVFKPHAGAIQIDATRVKVPPPRAPSDVTPPGEANKIIAEALGPSAAKLQVPSGPGADRLTAKMHGEHARVIAAYTGSYYRELNRALRTASASAAQKRVELLLNEALGLAPTYKGAVYRGLELSGAERAAFVAAHKQAMATGGTVGHAQFNSTSRKAGSSFGGSIRLVIESKNGVHVAPISLHAGEDEVLFRSDAKFRVLEVTESSGRATIRLEEV
jgi:SPP1 gp7 family putative phage head morphogenesis protein